MQTNGVSGPGQEPTEPESIAEKANATLRELDVLDPARFAKHGWYITGNWGDTLVTAFYPPNAYKRVAQAAAHARVQSASSLHPGGLNVLMGDGSVRFVEETIQSWPMDVLTGEPEGIQRASGGWWEHVPPPGLWQALSTRSDGEVLDSAGF